MKNHEWKLLSRHSHMAVSRSSIANNANLSRCQSWSNLFFRLGSLDLETLFHEKLSDCRQNNWLRLSLRPLVLFHFKFEQR